jgi:tight adherence protein C
MIIVIIFDILSLFCQLTGGSDSIILNGRYLLRPESGEGSTQVDLEVSMDQSGLEEGIDQESSTKIQEIQVNVEERIFTEEELEGIYEEAYQYLKTAVLADNKTAELIYTDLNFISEIPESTVSVDWEPENITLIASDGTVNNQGIEEEGVTASVRVILSCQSSHLERTITFHIMPRKYSETEKLINRLNEEILNASQETAADSMLKLPDVLGDYRLTWNDKKKDNNGVTLLFLGIGAAFAAWIGLDRELDKKMKKRREQMHSDYPELINKFTLLINAGMTIKQAWNKISEDYTNKSETGKEKKRFAYEEMLITVNELKLGVPENIAYEQYGRRIGLIPYIKFSSMISQNLKKGTRGFTDLLMKEAREAFEERKETAKRLGEEAGTKLLIPMMVLLIMVFLIIMIPAFMAFRI